MAGISNNKWILALAAVSLAFSCVKEASIEPVEKPEDEVFAEYDPVVRFGLETYMGPDEVTKTTYAGENKTVMFESKRYERINWNVGTSDSNRPQDVVRILSETDFTKDGGKKADYKATRLPGYTNVRPEKDDMADTAPLADGEEFFWSLDGNPRYFYGVYPSPNGTDSNLGDADIVIGAGNTAQILNAEIPAIQKYFIETEKENGIGEFGTRGTREYMPIMKNAYMYAAAVMPGASAGYKKVPLRFKPLFSAVKLIITARDGDVASDHATYEKTSRQKDYPAANYRLAKVELRTDINENDIYLRDGSNTNGTDLCGKFSATFRAADISGDVPSTTGDFSLIGAPTETGKRITINIPAKDRVCLNDDTLKLTFLTLPVDQQFMTVDYTFEYLLDGSDPNVAANWSDPLKIKTFHRTLALQDREKIFKNDDDSWYKLDATHKLYVRSAVPAIEYVFKVEAQSFFPRNFDDAGYSMVPGSSDHHIVENFYSVVSYRDSSGVLQPLKWQVTGYSTSPDGPFNLGNKPEWLAMCGETIGTYDPASDKAWYFDPENPDYARNGINTSGDPWTAAPWGLGSRMDPAWRVTTADIATGEQVYGYTKFNYDHTYVFYDAGAKNNGDPVRKWKKHVSANYCDQDGKFYYPVHDENGVPLPADIAKTPYAYDLSSHDIYGNLIVPKNGDLGTTANCYVISAPGWYRFPTVYGNAIVGGGDNQRAYKGDGGTHRLKWFKDYNNADITQPWVSGGTGPDLIAPGPDGVSLVWEDASDLVDAHLFAGSEDLDRGNKQKPFYWVDNDPDSPNKGNGYIYFYVNQISFSSAVLAAKNASGTIVWSWHIWCVPEPETNLKTIAIEPTLYNYREDSSNPMTPFPFVSVYGTTDVWEELDLGQGRKESSSNFSAPKKIYVEFKQYWRGKAINDADARRGRVVVCFAQSGLEDNSGILETPAYQWGRKDPLQVKAGKRENANTACTGNDLGTAIKNPGILYHGSAKESWHGSTRYDNLWNTNVDYYPTTFAGFDGKWYNPTQTDTRWYNYDAVPGTTITVPTGETGRKDKPVCKTIYDPCPPGYMVPNLFAFTAFNNRGMKQMRADGTKVASNASWTDANKIPEEDGTFFKQWTGFYVGYGEKRGIVDLSSGNPDRVFQNQIKMGDTNYWFTQQKGYYRRDQSSEKVKFYARGRVNGSSSSNTIGDPNMGFYWLAEPASHENYKSQGRWSYGSSFQFGSHKASDGAWIYPVTGGNCLADIKGMEPENSNHDQAKWQREHACYVRPMKEKDPPGL